MGISCIGFFLSKICYFNLFCICGFYYHIRFFVWNLIGLYSIVKDDGYKQSKVSNHLKICGATMFQTISSLVKIFEITSPMKILPLNHFHLQSYLLYHWDLSMFASFYVGFCVEKMYVDFIVEIYCIFFYLVSLHHQLVIFVAP